MTLKTGFLAALFVTAWATCALAGARPAKEISVVDGDTINAGHERIRIANIDAPEITRPKCDAERRLGLVAKRRLAELLEDGEPVIKRGDPATRRLKDRYGRTLATITVNGRDVGEMLVSELLARRWDGRRRNWCD